MEDKTYSITLADGTVIDDLKLNGNNFISKSPITKEIFEDCCSPVVISDGETEVVHDNMELVQLTRSLPFPWMWPRIWFILQSFQKLKWKKSRCSQTLSILQ